MNETLFQSATDAAEILRRKEISSRELTEMLLARIAAVNPALNAVVELRRDAALREAATADETIARGAAAILERGNVTSVTMRAFTSDEWRRATQG